jgi:hypothetical protein
MQKTLKVLSCLLTTLKVWFGLEKQIIAIKLQGFKLKENRV